MLVTGKVVDVNKENATAVVLVARPGACSHSCENCSSCEMASTSALVSYNYDCQIGDIVEAEIIDAPNMGLLSLVYLFPIAMLSLAYMVITKINSYLLAGVVALMSVGIFVFILKRVNKAFKDKIQGEIINLKKSQKN